MTGIPVLTDEAVYELAKQYAANDIDDWDVLVTNYGKVISRVPLPSGETIIFKLWSNSGWKNTIRAWTKTRPVDRELAVLTHLRDTPVRVPRLLGSAAISSRAVPYSQAAATEDLGDIVHTLEVYKKLMHDGEECAIAALEERMISISKQLLDHGVVDPDHSMVNMAVLPDGDVARIDFEVAHVVAHPYRHTKLCGEMLGRFLISFAWAAQPQMERLVSFADRMADQLKMTPAMLSIADKFMEDGFVRQQREHGLDMSWQSPW